MAILNAQLIFNNMNVSTQVGDIIYYTPTAPQGGFTQGALVNTVMLGPILSITLLGNGATRITVQYDDSISSLPFVNDSTDKVELFSIGSEVSESSK